jgi:hypothetical protein
MRRRAFASRVAVLFAVGLASAGCDGSNPVVQGEPGQAVVLRAAYTPLVSGRVYDASGKQVGTLSGTGALSVRLSAGTYYLDVRDDFGNSIYNAEGSLRFALAAEGASLDLAPRRVPGVDRPLVAITIGAGASPAYNHTMGNEASARARVVWEAARAMVGPAAANSYQWNTSGDVYSSFNYALEDPGAWAALVRAYGANLVSCRNVNDRANYYTPCKLTYGPDNLTQYSCQAGSCNGVRVFRAGQCKAAMNLVLYRSGVYHNANWGFRILPRDSDIPAKASKLTSASLQVGDALRRTGNPHAMIIVRVLSPTRAVVFDSNWVGGDGNERMATHVMSMYGPGSGANGGLTDLDTYYDLDCVYRTSGQC